MSPSTEPIAVIGSGCRFPGNSTSPSKFWDLLREPRDVLKDFASDRLNLQAFHDVDGGHHGKTDVCNQSYLLEEDTRLFDAAFFNVNPAEADSMDPQQRLTLETVYEAFESAGYTLQDMSGSLTAVYLGVMTSDYRDIQLRDPETINRYHATGTTASILSNRVSYYFNLKGPSATLDTACSSSLAAVHMAVQSLRNNDANVAVATGVNLIFDPAGYVSESKLHMLSPTSRSRMWDAGADGYARGEGVCAIVMKPLSQALKDGDHVECIIRETGMNSDGRTTGITMPSAASQTALIRRTYAAAGLDPVVDRPQYFECHGTGTLAGDPVEARAVYDAFFPSSEGDATASNDGNMLYCGSVKTVIGHTEGCAGLAGLLKASCALQNSTIPPNLLFETPNPAIAPLLDKLNVPLTATPWPTVLDGPRRASVNSFGFGGTNAHVIIESFDSKASPTQSYSSAIDTPASNVIGPLLLSSSTEASLATMAHQFSEFIKKHPSLDLDRLSFLTQTRRTTFDVRASFTGANADEILQNLDAAAKKHSEGINIGSTSALTSSTPAVLGIFTGQGAQWPTMGSLMMSVSQEYREAISRCEAALEGIPNAPVWSLSNELSKAQGQSRIGEAELSQPLCTATQIAMIDVLAKANIRFDAVVGHSSGEIAATYAAGMISATDAMRISYYRGFYAKQASGGNGKKGAMMAIGLGYEDALDFCKSVSGNIQVAASNGPSSSTLSGDEDAIQQAWARLDANGQFARLLTVDTAYHSRHMLCCSEEYLSSLKACQVKVSPPRIGCTWISSVYGNTEIIDDQELDTLKDSYWVDNMVRPVLFSEAVECSLWRAGPFDLVAEVGPHPALEGPTLQTIKRALASSLPYAKFLKRGKNDIAAFTNGIGEIWTHVGSHVNFHGLREAIHGTSTTPVKMIQGLPSYPWNHSKIHWKESRPSRRYRLGERNPHELLGRRIGDDDESNMRWRNILKLSEIPWLRGHAFQGQPLFATSAYMAVAIQAAAEIAAERPTRLVEVQDLVMPRGFTVPENHPGVETVFSVRRDEHNVNHDIFRGDFTFYTATGDAAGTMEKRCSGVIVIEYGDAFQDSLPPRPHTKPDLVAVEPEDCYDALLGVGLDYQGPFRGLKSMHRSFNYCTAKASWDQAELGPHYIMHPGPLDVAFHCIIPALASPLSGALWAPYLPVQVRRLTLDPNATYASPHNEILFDIEALITKSSQTQLEGDVNITDTQGRTGLVAEGLVLQRVKEASPSDDRPLFSKTAWKPDRLGSSLDLEMPTANIDDSTLAEAIERTALYFLKLFFSGRRKDDITDWTWYHRAFHAASHHVLHQTRQGTYPSAKSAWLNDDEATILALKARYPDSVDLTLMHAIAARFEGVLTGEVQLLEVMFEDQMLSRFYSEGRIFRPLNQVIGDLMQNFAFKYPRASILEIGAGTGGTTQNVLDSIGSDYGSYVYTDVSTGFFEKAKERFAKEGSSFTYKVLDVEKDPLAQGFSKGGQDVIIAANVLHATRNLEETLSHVRQLLKPGGYLILMEVTGQTLENLFIMGGLPGWWLGVDQGRIHGPGISLVEWDELLASTGFTGVDKHVMDLPDDSKHSCSVIVSQATSPSFAKLQDPVSHLEEIPLFNRLLLIGGRGLPVARLLKNVEKLCLRFADTVMSVKRIEDVTEEHTAQGTSVIYFSDLETPLFSDTVTPERLTKLQALYTASENILWLTSGRLAESPYANMSVGLGRALVTELPQLNLQFLDLDPSQPIPHPRAVVEIFLKLSMPKMREFSDEPILHSFEQEALLREGLYHVPRLVLDVEKNNRVNSERRTITKDAMLYDSPVTIAYNKNTLSLCQDTPWLGADAVPPPDTTIIRVALSIALPHGEREQHFLVLGHQETGQSPVLAISSSNSSRLHVPRSDVLTLEQSLSKTPSFVRKCAEYLAAYSILDTFALELTDDAPALVYEPPLELAKALIAVTGRKTVFATSRSSFEIPGCIQLHPVASEHRIRSLLPKGLRFCLSFSTDPNDRVAQHLSNMFHSKSHVRYGNHAVKKLSKALSGALASPNHSTSQDIVRVQDLPSQGLSAGLYPTVIDWRQSDRAANVNVNPIYGHGMFAQDKTYVMVGLTSDLGRSICRWMVENGARHIVLASRTPSIDQIWLDEVAALGGQIATLPLDVADKACVQSFYEQIKRELPPIGGVCNGALVLQDKLFVEMDETALNDVFAPKVAGTSHLDEIFTDPTIDFFISFSSTSSIAGNAGQSNYNAASLYQAALASRRRARGLPASLLTLGIVVDVGYIAQRGQEFLARLNNIEYYLLMSEADVLTSFAEAVAASRPDATDESAEVICGLKPFMYNSATTKFPSWFENPRFSHLVREVEDETRSPGSGSKATQRVRAAMDAAPTEEKAADVLTESFTAKLESMLQMAPGTLKPETSLLDLGVDSLLAVEIRTWFLKEVHVDVPVLQTLGGDSSRDLCAGAAKKYVSANMQATKGQPSSEQPVSGENPLAGVDSELKDTSHSSSSDSAEHDTDADTASTGETTESSMTSSLVAQAAPAPDKPSERTPPPTPSTKRPERKGAVPFMDRALHNEASPVSKATAVRRNSPAVLRKAPASEVVTSANEDVIIREENLSFAQSRLWFMLQLSNDPLLYNSISIYELTGAVQASRLRQAVASVVAHHESLHLSFYEKPATGLPVQGLLKTPLESFKHIVGAKSGRVETEIERLKHHEWLLHQGNGLQVVLVSHNAREHHLLIAYHHIVMDGVGHYFFLRDLNTAYRGLPLRKIELGYMDLSVREQQRFQQGHLDADLRFWEKLVRPDRPAIELLPFSSTKTRPLLSVHQNHESRKMLGAPLVRMINDASRRLRISPFHFYTAAIQTLLYRLLDLRDVCIGVTDANRDTESAEMPGLFLNLLPLVFDIDGASTFGQLASRTHRIHREAQKHGFVPLDIILNKANIPRDRTHTPLFQVVINYRQGNSAQLPLGNARLQCISVEEAKSPYDIAFTITPADEVSYVQVITRSDLYSQDATNLCSDLLVTLLGEAASDWSRLLDAYQLYDTKQVQKATELGKASTVDFGWPGTLTALVDNMISTYPKEPAVYDQEGTISYATLGQKVNDLASSIRATHWPQKHPRVAVICQPSKDWIISMLAILRLGGVYVPLDTTLPDDRLSKILDSANPDLILCHQPTQQRALDLADKNTVLDFEDAPTKSRDLIPDEEQPGKLSFILFTSGSTGTPKGVMLTQTGIINYLASKVDRCALKTETVLQQSALGFDMSLAQAFHALARGGKLIIAPASSRGDPFALSRLMVDQSVSMTVATPTEYLMLLRYGVNGLKSCSSWCNAFSGGEAVTAELKRAFTLMKQPPTLTDCYGPTEISCCATMHTVSLDVHEDAVIGRPNPNSSIYILDEHGSCLPVGMPGEIAVGGNGLAMGYLDPNATETKFALITAPNATDSTCLRVYKTGDKGVFRSDGNLKYLGRIDGETTVKVHGARLDLQDVSNTMLHASEGQLLDAIVTVRGNPAFLVAHVVLNDHSSLDLPAFANSLPLPRYMKPAVVVPVTSLPVNANGKVDRIAVATFPLPGESNAVDSSLEKRPLSITEGELKLLWMNVLGQTKTERTPLRSTSDFFLCGGTSMNLVKLQALIRTSIGLELSIPDLYENSTIESMAALITEQGRDKRQICIDWTSDTALPANLDFSISSSPVRVGSTRGIEILMTGTDGFFGSAIASRLLKDPAVSHIHCLAVESEQITSHWNHKKATVYAGSLSEDRLGLDSSTFKRLQKSVSRVILAGSQGHCLNNYTSLRTPNVLSVEQLAIFALPRRIPIHFISSGRTTLLNPAAEAALPQVSVAEHAPPKDGSEGFTASKWAAEVILEKFAVAASDSGNPLPVMIHRPGALIGDDAPIEDALNALIRFSRMLHAVPRTDNLDLAGYLDFKYVSEAADEVCRTITSPLFDEKSDPRLVRFVHHSGRVKVPPTQFKQHMEKTFKIPFEELELDEWLQMAQNEGLEDLIVAYLREVTALGETLVFPYLGQD